MQRQPFIAAMALLIVVGLSGVALATDDAAKSAPSGVPQGLLTRDVPSQNLPAQQVVHLLDYVAADYGGAVSGGQVVNEKELEEQIEVLAEAARLAARLPPPRGAFVPSEAVIAVKRLVEAHRPEADVAAAAKNASSQFVAFFDLVQAPHSPLSRERGKQLFEQHCAACHGLDGRADTPRALQYNPRPANFHAPEVARALSPLRVSRAVRFGVPNTAMVPFDFLSEEERWDIAFYVSELDHPAAPGKVHESRMFGLAELAAESDDELRADLTSAGVQPSDAEAALSDLRRRAPYDAVTLDPMAAGAMVLRARAGLRKVALLLLRGDREAARATLIGVYLDNVEHIEAPLRAVSPGLVSDIEISYKGVRTDIESGAPLETTIKKIDAFVVQMVRAGADLEKGTADSFPVTAFKSAVIALREGVEAALLIAALLAVVGRSGLPERKRWVHAGWITAAVATAITWLVSRRIVEMSGLGRETLEGVAALLAALVLFYVSYWLFAKREAARWVTYLRTKAKMQNAAISLFGISFLAVYREGFETIIFYQALVAQPGAGPAASLGAVLGVALLVGLVIAYGRAGKFAPPQSFFAFSSLLLYALAVVFAGQGIAALQMTGLVPLHPAPLPHLPALGVYPTIETYAVQGALVLLALAAFVVTRAHRAPPAPPGATGDPIRGSREGAKL